MNKPTPNSTYIAPRPFSEASATDSDTLRALDDLRLVVASESQALKHCFIFTFAARNNILRATTRLKQHMAPIRCDLTREVMSLIEIITMMCARSNTHKDREGMEHIQLALHLIEDFVTSSPISSSQRQHAVDAIEDLWCWIDKSAY